MQYIGRMMLMRVLFGIVLLCVLFYTITRHGGPVCFFIQETRRN